MQNLSMIRLGGKSGDKDDDCMGDLLEFLHHLKDEDSGQESTQNLTKESTSDQGKSEGISELTSSTVESHSSNKKRKDLHLNTTTDRIEYLMTFPKRYTEILNSGHFDSLPEFYADFCIKDFMIRPPNMAPTIGDAVSTKMLMNVFQTMPDMCLYHSPPQRQHRFISCLTIGQGTYIGTSTEEESRMYNMFKSPYRESMIKKEVCELFDLLEASGKSMIIKFKLRLNLILNKDMTYIEQVLGELKDIEIMEGSPIQALS